jgi:hypothetical protein
MLMDVVAVANDKSLDVDNLRRVGGTVAEVGLSSVGGLWSDIETSPSSDPNEESGELDSEGGLPSGKKSSSSSVGGGGGDELDAGGGSSSDIKRDSSSLAGGEERGELG